MIEPYLQFLVEKQLEKDKNYNHWMSIRVFRLQVMQIEWW